MKQTIPSKLLSRIVIETPCNQDWGKMEGDERKRHCSSCKKFVHNLSEMSTEEALKLLDAREPVCVRLFRRPDGTVLTKECTPGKVKRWRGYAVMSAAACALLSFIGFKSVAAEELPQATPTPSVPEDHHYQRGVAITGELAVPPGREGWLSMGGIRPMPPEEVKQLTPSPAQEKN